MKGDYNKEVWARRWNDVVMFVFPSVVVLVNMWYPGILVCEYHGCIPEVYVFKLVS